MSEIPEQISELMTDEELENMKNRDGWTTGTIHELDENGEVVNEFTDAWIELFDGNGRAGVFDGVKYMYVDEDGEYDESYAHESQEHLEERLSDELVGDVGSVGGSYPCYVVVEYNDTVPYSNGVN